MSESFDIWKVLAGVAIFLLGVRFLEESLQQLIGRRFKLFLKRQTSRKIKAVGGGAIVTAVLQSSSVVSLMVLAFVGAGVITMQNALAVILGANLGTTFTGWLVALVGFKVNIESIALPLTGVAGLAMAIVNKNSRFFNWSRFLLGFSFLFVGLGYIKDGMLDLVTNFDLQQYEHSPVIVFFIVGFIITAIIQSSSATVAIALSALHAGAISLFDATAIILGSEIGATIKLFIASIKGIAAKRRVALGNFIFNILTVFSVFIFLKPVNIFVSDIIGIKDNLIALVFFQTLVNVIGIILFYPLLNLFGRFLESRFSSADEEAMYIHKVSFQEPSMALFALERENRHFLFAVIDFFMECFELENKWRSGMNLNEKFLEHTIYGKYEYLKYLHGEVHSFSIRLQKSLSHKEDFEKLDRYISSVRNCMYAAKSVKDALPDLEQLKNSSNDIKFDFYNQAKKSVEKFCISIHQLLTENPAMHFDTFASAYHAVTEGYTITLKQFYKETTSGKVNEKEITTLLNFNRTIFTAFKSMIFGIKDYLLDKEHSKYFDELPGFIR